MAGIPIPPGGGTPLPARPSVPVRPNTPTPPRTATAPKPTKPSAPAAPNKPPTSSTPTNTKPPANTGTSESKQLKDLKRKKPESPGSTTKEPNAKKGNDASSSAAGKESKPEPLKNKYASEAQSGQKIDGKKPEKGGGAAGKAGAEGPGALGKVTSVAKKAATATYFGSMAANTVKNARNKSKTKKDVKAAPPTMEIGADGKKKSTDSRVNDKGKVKNARELRIDSAKARAAGKNAKLEAKGKTEKTRKKYVDKYGQEQGEKSTAADRFKNGMSSLGRKRCLICGYQNGLNNEQICRRCAKRGRNARSAQVKAERAANKATDVTAMVAAQALEKFTFGIANAQLTQGYIGKIAAFSQRNTQRPIKWVAIGLALILFIPLGFGLLGAVVAISGGDLGKEPIINPQASIEAGDIKERAIEPIGSPQIVETYQKVAGEEGVPWSIVAGLTGVATEHGRISPYTGEEVPQRFPALSTPIAGGGSGPFLLAGNELRSKEDLEKETQPDEKPSVSLEDAGSQNFSEATRQVAVLLAEARDEVYSEKQNEFNDKGYTYDDLVENPFSEGGVEFWTEVIRYLPLDYEIIEVPVPAGEPTNNDSVEGGVTLGPGKDAVISQIMWAQRWIESGNNYGEFGGPNDCYTGAYQFGWIQGGGCYNTWANYRGFAGAHLTGKKDQDDKMREVLSPRYDTYGGDVKKIVQHHLCPAKVGEDLESCGTSNPDMGTYWACAAVLLNALPGNKYEYKFTRHPTNLASYQANCEGRIASALTDTDLPPSARKPEGQSASLSTGQPVVAQLIQAEDPAPSTPAPEVNSDTPKSSLVALAALQRASEYSGVPVTLLKGGGEDKGEDADSPNYDGPRSDEGFVWPADGVTGPNGKFGLRDGANHNGIDISPPLDGAQHPIRATKDGTVVVFHDGCPVGRRYDTCGGMGFGGYGNSILIQHSDDLFSFYAHIERGTIKVKEGDIVKAGQEIAVVGSSGDSGGLHLHFELRTSKYGGAFDPEKKLPDR